MTARSQHEQFESDGVATIGTRATGVCCFTREPGAAGGRRATAGRFAFDARVAYHEAGHAVAARLCGLPVAGASILLEGGHHGRVWSDDAHRLDVAGDTSDLVAALLRLMPGPFEARDDVAVDVLRVHDQIIALLAGRESELLFTGMALDTAHDRQEACALASLICRSPRSIGAYLDFARVEAIALLNDHADAVHALADALLHYRTLDGSQIDQIIKRG